MIKIVPCSDLSINDLCELGKSNIPVTMTSHPGNASLYKLSLWSCGISEYLWDITCSKADKNNWPKHILAKGEAIPLLSDYLIKNIDENTSQENRYVTAYLRSDLPEYNYGSCGRIHVRAMQENFPSVISSSSRLLLEEKEKLLEVFAYLADTWPEKTFPRFITENGVLVKREAHHVRACDLAESCMNVFSELDHLLFSDLPLTTKGGACYGGAIVPLALMLVQYWKTGETHRYDISGPDMIHYATRKDHQEELSLLLDHLQKWDSRYVPKNITVHMPLGTVARVGYLQGHHSENIMKRKLLVTTDNNLDSEKKKMLRLEAAQDESLWPFQINPSLDKYFSQHDLSLFGKNIVVDEFWRDVPLGDIFEMLSRANNKLSSRK